MFWWLGVWLACLCVVAAKLEDFYVESVPGAELDTETYAGSLEVPVNDHVEHMFFWLFEAKYRTTKPKTMIWLNGGPGCSSLDGVLLEIGPLRFTSTDNIQYNEGNWNEYINILYVDQPFGTGFSFIDDSSDFVANVEQAAKFMDEFLERWLEEFPHHKHDEFYLAGESYAGQYVPYMQRNLKAVKPQGLVLLNPWIDAAHQYLSYAPFAKEHNLLASEHFAQLDKLHQDCIESLQTHTIVPTNEAVCNRVTDFVLRQTTGQKTCINVYNYKLEDTWPSCGMNWPEGVKDLAVYLNKPEVHEALHVHPKTAQKWTECSDPVNSHLRNFDMPSASSLLPDILDEIPVLIMVGDDDFICNIDGLNLMVDSLVWQGDRGLGIEEPLQWLGQDVGGVRSGRGLTMARITNGSHMIPVDKQFETRAVLHKFLNITGEYDMLPAIGGPSGAPSGAPGGPSEEGAEPSELDEARKSAYKRAGFVALIIIVVLLGGAMFWLIKKGDVHISWSSITSGFTRALLHVGAPKLRRPFEYVNLDTFRPSGRPSTIIEEDEEEEFEA